MMMGMVDVAFWGGRYGRSCDRDNDVRAESNQLGQKPR